VDSQAVKPPGDHGFYRKMITPVDFETDLRNIRPGDNLYFGGSCFAENLHSFWVDHFLPGAKSPFGNIYNPRSLKECFTLLCRGTELSEKDFFLHKGLWRHSLFSTATVDTDPIRLKDHVNTLLGEHKKLLASSDYLIITLGTAFVFDEKSSGRTVNNCHKRPSSDFKRHPLAVDEITQELKELAAVVRKENPRITLIVTLSPVRHLRDRAEENSLSKALLRCGIDQFIKEERGSLYFPSSEIMLDELRDYRWYAEDLVHPSETAVNYIMNRFCSSLGNAELGQYLTEAEKLKGMLEHRVLFPGTEEGRKFIEKRDSEISGFREKYPFSRV